MITFKAIIIPNNKRADGTYPVKIRVTFKGVVRRLPTTLVCKQNDLTRGNKIKNADILFKAEELINRMRLVTRDMSPFDLENKDVDWVVSKIKDALAEENFTLDFISWGREFILAKSDATRGLYTTALNAFARFLGRDSIDINDISKSMLLDFIAFVDAEPKMWYNRRTGATKPSKSDKIKGKQAFTHLSKLQHIFNAAKAKFNDEDTGKILIPRSPFSSIEKEYIATVYAQRNLGIELMQQIISYQTDDKKLRTALDIFIVSFCLMGANMADLYVAKNVGNVWVYNRSKTASRRKDKAEIKVVIPEQAQPYIARLQGKRSQWWLPVLHEISDCKKGCSDFVNRHLKKWCIKNDVDEFTMYAARHSWASIGRAAGIEKATIDDGLCHKGLWDMTDIYAEKSWGLVWEANQKILELFKWE